VERPEVKGRLLRERCEGTGSEGTRDRKVEEMSIKGWRELTEENERRGDKSETGNKDIRKLGN